MRKGYLSQLYSQQQQKLELILLALHYIKYFNFFFLYNK